MHLTDLLHRRPNYQSLIYADELLENILGTHR